MKSLRDILTGGQVKSGLLSFAQEGQLQVTSLQMCTSLYDIQTSPLTSPACALLPHPKKAPHFAVCWINRFTVVHFKTTPCSLHTLSETRVDVPCSHALNSCPGVQELHPQLVWVSAGQLRPEHHTFSGHLALNLEWMYRGFRTKGREFNWPWQGSEEHPEGSYLWGFCPGLLPHVQMWMSEWLLAAKLEMLCRDLLACYWHVTCLLACYHS